MPFLSFPVWLRFQVMISLTLSLYLGHDCLGAGLKFSCLFTSLTGSSEYSKLGWSPLESDREELILPLPTLCHQREVWDLGQILECSFFHSTGVWWQNYILAPFFPISFETHKAQERSVQSSARSGKSVWPAISWEMCGQPTPVLSHGTMWPWTLWQLRRQKSYLIFPERIIESNMYTLLPVLQLGKDRQTWITDQVIRETDMYSLSCYFRATGIEYFQNISKKTCTEIQLARV